MRTLIVDGNNTAFQALGKAPLFHQGHRTEVIKIVLGMLRGYLERFDPDAVVVAWDGGRDERRKKIHPEYKYHKKRPTEAERQERECVFEQMRLLVPIISGLGIEQCKAAGREGDDTIYTLLKTFTAPGERFVISTDQDMFQLLTYFDDVRIFSPIKKLIIDRDWVEQTFDIPYNYFTMYKSLMGDPGDNIPGIRGIGPKKAVALIKYMVSSATPEQKEHKLLDIVHSQQELAKQTTLVTLLDVPEEDMVEGWVEPQCEGGLDEHIMSVSNQYGFNSIIERHGQWIAPFIRHAVKRGYK